MCGVQATCLSHANELIMIHEHHGELIIHVAQGGPLCSHLSVHTSSVHTFSLHRCAGLYEDAGVRLSTSNHLPHMGVITFLI